MRHYELLIVLKPTLTEEEVNTKFNFVKEVLEKNKAQIAYIDNIGIRKLAYEIQKCERGHYFVIYYKADPSVINEILRNVRLTEEIIRFLNIKYETKKEIYWWQELSNPKNKNSSEEENTQTKEDVQKEQ